MMLNFVERAVGFLAASTETFPADDKLNRSLRDGMLNDRTGRGPGVIYQAN